MIKPEELYNKTKMPVDMTLLNSLLEKYKSISMHKLDFSLNSKLVDSLYNQINQQQSTVLEPKKLKQDEEKLLSELNQDFINSGRNFKPELHNGITNPLGVQAGWNTFKSWHLLGTSRIPNEEQIHRFYIGITNNNKYDFAYELYNEFKRANIPFYFKMDAFSEDRPDKIVIYTSTSLLSQTMAVLGNIENRRNNLMMSCISPSVIVGKVTDKIGYASEITNSGVSYTQLICNSLADAIKSVMNEYMKGTIKESVKRIYDQKVNELQTHGYFLESSEKMKIAFEVLMEYDPTFKTKLLDIFRSNLSNAGIDLNNMCFSKEGKKEIKKQYNLIENNKIDIFDPDVLNRVITLPNGKIMTIDEYLKINRVWSLIPLNATVMIRNLGISMSGTKFIENVIKRANQFTNIQDLFEFYGVVVDRNNSEKKLEEIIDPNLDDNQKGFEDKNHRHR